jgi:hypothetical protein
MTGPVPGPRTGRAEDAVRPDGAARGHRAPRSDLTRRAVLVLGVGAAATLTGASAATAASVVVGSLTFAVPSEIVRSADDMLGRHWQWQGRDTSSDARAQTVVLARGDLSSTDPEEILGLVLAGSGSGLLPGLALGTQRRRSMPGGGDQLRIDVSYTASRGVTYHGTMLVATRSDPPAGLLVVLGDARLTAGTIDGVLDSARWQ